MILAGCIRFLLPLLAGSHLTFLKLFGRIPPRILIRLLGWFAEALVIKPGQSLLLLVGLRPGGGGSVCDSPSCDPGSDSPSCRSSPCC